MMYKTASKIPKRSKLFVKKDSQKIFFLAIKEKFI